MEMTVFLKFAAKACAERSRRAAPCDNHCANNVYWINPLCLVNARFCFVGYSVPSCMLIKGPLDMLIKYCVLSQPGVQCANNRI